MTDPTRRTRWYHRLTVRLTLLGLAAVLAAVGGTGWMMLKQAEADVLVSRQQLELAEAERTAGLLNERVRQLMAALELVASQAAGAAQAGDQTMQDLLHQRPLLLGMFNSVFFASDDGRMRLIHDERGFRRTDINLKDRDYFREVMATAKPTVSAPVMGRVSGEPVVVFAVPVLNAGRVVGVLGGGVRLRNHPLLSGLDAAPAAQALARPTPTDREVPLIALTDAQAHLVWHPDRSKIGQSVDQEPALLAPLAAWAGAAGPVAPQARSASDARYLGAYAGMPAAGWLVWRLQPRSLVLAPFGEARQRALVLGSAIAVVLTALLLLVLWILLAPLRQLRARVDRLFEPGLAADAGWPDARGELGEMGAALQRVLVDKQAGDAQRVQTLQQLHSVLQAAPMAILLTRGRVLELVSPEACRLLRRAEAELVGQPARVLYASNQDYEQLGPQVGHAFASQQTFVGELLFLRGDGSSFWGRLSGRPVAWADASAGTIWTLADITAEREEREQLQWTASHDGLTGLANRAVLTRQLGELLASRASATPSALLLMDLDRFKPINDGHGHAAGDAMLRAVALAIGGCVRSGDVVARLGGDEFGVVLLQCPADVAQRVAESICQQVAALRLPWQGQQLHVGISVGVAALAQEVDSVASWLARADAACYEAKAAGRGSVKVAGSTAASHGLRLVSGDRG